MDKVCKNVPPVEEGADKIPPDDGRLLSEATGPRRRLGGLAGWPDRLEQNSERVARVETMYTFTCR